MYGVKIRRRVRLAAMWEMVFHLTLIWEHWPGREQKMHGKMEAVDDKMKAVTMMTTAITMHLNFTSLLVLLIQDRVQKALGRVRGVILIVKITQVGKEKWFSMIENSIVSYMY